MKIFYFFLLVNLNVTIAWAQNWVPVIGNYENKKNFVFDSTSLKTYPGLVVFNTRYQISVGKPDNQMYYFHKLALLCGSKEVYGIASALHADKNFKPTFVSEVSDTGLVEHMQIPSLATTIAKSCGNRYSKDDIEIPITYTNHEITFMIPKETTFNGSKLIMWNKVLPYTKEPYMHNGEEIKIDGEVIYNKKINKNSGWALASWEYDCYSKKIAGVSTIDYDSNGKVKSSFDFPGRNFKSAVPGSVGKAALEFACGLR